MGKVTRDATRSAILAHVTRSLHLACLPFSSPQGTQALIGGMLEALASSGHEPHLLTYAAGDTRPTSYAHHRLSDVPRVTSLRSGPSLGKVVLDARMILEVRRLARRIRADVVVAHNVEAAWVARLARVRPRIYVAHTRFDTELPTYASRGHDVLANLGSALDAGASRADAVGAVSPALAEHFEGARWLPPPWPVAPPVSAAERRIARAELGVSGPVALYAGNLDGYQGWENVVRACAPDVTLLVATASHPAPLHREARNTGTCLAVTDLRTEAQRVRAHAAADLALVPRRAQGGLPVKLLDALARGVPVAAEARALAGLQPAGVVVGALGESLRRVLAHRERDALGEAGRSWIAEHCAPDRFVRAFEDLVFRAS